MSFNERTLNEESPIGKNRAVDTDESENDFKIHNQDFN